MAVVFSPSDAGLILGILSVKHRYLTYFTEDTIPRNSTAKSTPETRLGRAVKREIREIDLVVNNLQAFFAEKRRPKPDVPAKKVNSGCPDQ